MDPAMSQRQAATANRTCIGTLRCHTHHSHRPSHEARPPRRSRNTPASPRPAARPRAKRPPGGTDPWQVQCPSVWKQPSATPIRDCGVGARLSLAPTCIGVRGRASPSPLAQPRSLAGDRHGRRGARRTGAGGLDPAPHVGRLQPVSSRTRPRGAAIRTPCVPCALPLARGLPRAAWGRPAVAPGSPQWGPRRAAGEPVWEPKSSKKPKTFHY